MFVRLAVLALIGSLAACAALRQPDPPTVSIAGLGIGRPGLFEQELRVDLRLENPNDHALAVDALNFDLEVNDRHFARGRTLGDFELPARGDTVVPVTVTVTTTDLVERLVRLGAEQRLGYRLTGTAELGDLFGYSVPFERNGELAVPDLRDILPATSPAPGR